MVKNFKKLEKKEGCKTNTWQRIRLFTKSCHQPSPVFLTRGPEVSADCTAATTQTLNFLSIVAVQREAFTPALLWPKAACAAGSWWSHHLCFEVVIWFESWSNTRNESFVQSWITVAMESCFSFFICHELEIFIPYLSPWWSHWILHDGILHTSFFHVNTLVCEFSMCPFN